MIPHGLSQINNFAYNFFGGRHSQFSFSINKREMSTIFLGWLWFLAISQSHYPRRKLEVSYTAISGKFVGKSARDKPERYCGWFWVLCSSKKFERIAQEAIDICLRVLKESNKRMFDSYIVRKSVLTISHITFRDCRVHIFTDNLSQNSCIRNLNARPRCILVDRESTWRRQHCRCVG